FVATRDRVQRRNAWRGTRVPRSRNLVAARREHTIARAGDEPAARSFSRGPGATRTGGFVLPRDREGRGCSDGHGHVCPVSRARTVSARSDRFGEATRAEELHSPQRCRSARAEAGCCAGVSDRLTTGAPPARLAIAESTRVRISASSVIVRSRWPAATAI